MREYTQKKTILLHIVTRNNVVCKGNHTRQAVDRIRAILLCGVYPVELWPGLTVCERLYLSIHESFSSASITRQRVDRDSDDTVTTERSKRWSERHTVLCTGRNSKRQHGDFSAFSARQRQPSYKLTSPLLLSPLQLVQRPNARGHGARSTNADGRRFD